MVEQSQGGEKKGYHEVEGKDMVIPIITFGSKGKRRKEKLKVPPLHTWVLFLSLSSVPSCALHLFQVTFKNPLHLFVSPRQFLIFPLVHEPFLNELLSSI